MDVKIYNKPMKKQETLAVTLEFIILIGSIAVSLMWLIGKPLFYYTDAPVMSIFTAFSLMLMSGARLARRFLIAWPMPMTLAFLGLVIGGNLSSILMLTSVRATLMLSFPDLVMTSVMTSIGLILFSLYDLLIVLRETPQSTFILDDILLHLALVPGGLSLLGHLLNNPAYLSSGTDVRVGISILEMLFMASFATTAVLSNRQLFLWQFLVRPAVPSGN